MYSCSNRDCHVAPLLVMTDLAKRHCERSEAISWLYLIYNKFKQITPKLSYSRDCHVATLLAMTDLRIERTFGSSLRTE